MEKSSVYENKLSLRYNRVIPNWKNKREYLIKVTGEICYTYPWISRREEIYREGKNAIIRGREFMVTEVCTVNYSERGSVGRVGHLTLPEKYAVFVTFSDTEEMLEGRNV